MNNYFNNKILILDDVLSRSECEKVIQTYNFLGPSHEWDGTFPLSIKLYDDFLGGIVKKIETEVNKFFSNKLKVDWAEVVEWPIGSFKSPHYDKASEKTIFTSITYLNHIECGGETYIVNDLIVPTKVGRTLCFDGNFYEHGVLKVESGKRYTIPIWYKMDKYDKI